ncbi:MAG: hypothetical protein AAGA99_03850 [Actinomycetota bacterium]
MASAPAPVRTRTASLVRRRLDAFPPWVLLIQTFIGLGWLRAGVEKLISVEWWTGTELEGFLALHAGETLPWYLPFVELVVSPSAAVVSFVVMAAQFAIAGSLLSGRRVGLALCAGMLLNLHFIAAGAVAPSVFYLLAQGAVALWMAEQRRTRQLSVLLTAVSIGGAAMAGASLLAIRTIDPALVIEDPALMLVTVGAFGAAASIEVMRRHDEHEEHVVAERVPVAAGRR